MTAFKLIQVAYVSTCRENITAADVDQIVEAAARHNAELGITGLLLWRHNQFFQVLEGTELAVDILLRHIRADSRHSNLTVIYRKQVAKRKFGSWSMGQATPTAKTGKALNVLEAVLTDPVTVLNDENELVLDLIESFRRGLWDVR